MFRLSFQTKAIHIEPLIVDINNNIESNGDVINNGNCVTKHISVINNILQTIVNVKEIDFIISNVFML